MEIVVVQNALLNLPEPDAELRDLIKFCRRYDPTKDFMKAWGSEFRDRLQELWGASTLAFKEGRSTGYNSNEVLLCMVYDVTIAPYIGVPEKITHSYLHAMIRELRDSL